MNVLSAAVIAIFMAQQGGAAAKTTKRRCLYPWRSICKAPPAINATDRFLGITFFRSLRPRRATFRSPFLCFDSR